MTPSSVISGARDLLFDLSPPYKYPDAEMLRYVNDGMDAVLAAAPRLFYAVGEIVCTEGQAVQQACLTGVGELIDIIRVKNGNALTKMDKTMLDAFKPAWHLDTAGPATQWQRLLDDPVKFYIYPPAPADQVLEIVYLPSPRSYELTDTLPLPDSYQPTLIDFVVYRAGSSRRQPGAKEGPGMPPDAFMTTFIARFKEAKA